jgi:hypothetical protein
MDFQNDSSITGYSTLLPFNIQIELNKKCETENIEKNL